MTTIHGMAATKAAFAKLAAVAPVAAERAREVIAEGVSDDARATVAVDTGATQASIHVTDIGVEAAEASIFLEFGTIHMSAQPFLRPAADGAERYVPKAATEAGAVIEAAF